MKASDLTNYSGMRPLGEVLEQRRVSLANRAASLEDGYLYGVRGTHVVRFEILKRTPKFVKFATGNPAPPGYTGRDHLECYAEREPLERDGRVGLGWGPPYRQPAGVSAVYLSREAAESEAAKRSGPVVRRCVR